MGKIRVRNPTLAQKKKPLRAATPRGTLYEKTYYSLIVRQKERKSKWIVKILHCQCGNLNHLRIPVTGWNFSVKEEEEDSTSIMRG